MSMILPWILAALSLSASQNSLDLSQQKKMVLDDLQLMTTITPIWSAGQESVQSISDISQMLQQESPALSQPVINKVLMTLKCAGEYSVEHNHILTIIDYSLPSNQKRLWVFDLNEKKLLFYTYVSHGIKSGALVSNYFSNKYNSKASSIGVYQTQKAYYGRDGLSLRLDGLDRSFNDNASNRAVVIHSGWYVEEDFIKKYGRPGRSWGCPALPLENSQAIISTIKDKSLLVIYYPSDSWFSKSKFLNCDKMMAANDAHSVASEMLATAPDDQREAILFLGSGYKGDKHAETKPVAVIAADMYQRIFHQTAPLTRMLRRQINHAEYVALSSAEFNYLANNPGSTEENNLKTINFVIPVMKQVRGGYYETQMQIVNLGKIKDVKVDMPSSNFMVYFEGHSPVSLNPSNQFIRWVGL